MSFIPKDAIIIWPGTNASIPDGWVRETALDAVYPKAYFGTYGANVTGGSANHTHAATANHGHTIIDHGHSSLIDWAGGDGNDSDSGGTELNAYHRHTPTIYGANGGSLSSVSATYASVSNDPPYKTVIYIKPSTPKVIPSQAITFWNEVDPPTGFNHCNGDNSTPDYRNLYLKGAAAGADAGDTGGSYTNIHGLTHTHVESSHYHLYTVHEAGDVPNGGRRGSGSGGRTRLVHYHLVYLNSSTAGSISTVSLTTTETVEPAYIKIAAIQNTAGVSRPVTRGMIALWLGSLTAIPAGWRICNGLNDTPNLLEKYFKIINTTDELGDTGGSNTHTHASQNHSHTGGSHTHTYNSGSSNLRHDYATDGANGVGGGWEVQNKDRAHSGVTNIGSSAVSWANAATSASSSSNEPPFRTVAPIQFKFAPTAGMLLGFL